MRYNLYIRAQGFDIVHHFDAERVLVAVGLSRLHDPARPVGVLVGNTRALWEPLLAARTADPALAASADPIQRYTEAVVGGEASRRGGTVYYVHARYDGAYIPFQRIAVAAGLAALAPIQLLVHPTYGPWFALRALMLCPGERPPEPIPAVLPCTCDAPCRRALDAALASIGPEAWRAWLSVRDSCPVGRDHRYGDNQIAYHYTKDLRYLR